MSVPVRVTWFFGQAQSGWSETLWFPNGRGTQFYAELQELTVKRVDMLAANHSLLAVRVTDEGANRWTRLIVADKPTRIDAGLPIIKLPGRGKEDGVGSNLEGPPDQVRAALQTEVVRDGQRIGLRYLAGIPDSITETEPKTFNDDFTKTWWKLFNNWRVELLTSGWAIQALNKGTNFPLIDVITYRLRAAAPSVLGVTISTSAAWTHTIGKKVALQGVKMTRRGLESPNKTWIIDGVESDVPNAQRTIWLRGTEAFDPDTFMTLGKIRAVEKSYVVPTHLEPLRVGIHKRGKPFGSPVGRRPTRR
jgi:hypothetical protein